VVFFSGFSITILSHTLILPVSQLQTQQLMTSQIRSHIDYLIHIYNILLIILHSKLMKNIASLTVFNDLRMIIDSGCTIVYMYHHIQGGPKK